MSKRFILHRVLLAAAAAVGLTGCTVSSTETPDLSGPSELALSFSVTATPDSVSWDGGSQTAIIVSAYDHTGSPKGNVTFKLDMLVGGTPTDFGTLSTKTVITGNDGRGSAFYTAPAPLPAGSNVPTCSGVTGGCVQIAATPVGTDFYAANTQTVTVRLVPMGVILPPAGTPVAAFSFNPDNPETNLPVAFDASASCADGSASVCSNTGLSYHWDFGDGRVGSGRTAQHAYGLARTHNVVLTVTNERGRQASISKPITVGAGVDPSAAFVYSPKPVVINSAVNFDASGSRPAPGHLITGYKWNWGDGTSSPESSSPLASHTYTAQGAYTVVLTVYDESGQTGTKTEVVDVGLGNPTANFTFIKSGLTVDFDGRSSVAVGAATITSYAWNFGDAATGTGSTTSHTYAGNGTYNVTLTVTDSTGKVGVVSKTVTLP